MENASKALLIVASVLLGLVILSSLMMLYNQVSTYYQQKNENAELEQMVEFNKKFENYSGKEVRGNDMLSIINMIEDYNTTYTEEEGYKKISLDVDLKDSDYIEQFHYDDDSVSISGGSASGYLLTTSKTKITEKDTTIFSERTNNIIYDLNQALKDKASVLANETILQQLSSNVANIVINEKEKEQNNSRRKRLSLIKSLFKIDIETNEPDSNIDKTTYSANEYYKTKKQSDKNVINAIKKAALQYYEITQFKRAMFKCTNIKHDNTSGRVIGMEFEIIDDNGKIVFN